MFPGVFAFLFLTCLLFYVCTTTLLERFTLDFHLYYGVQIDRARARVRLRRRALARRLMALLVFDATVCMHAPRPLRRPFDQYNSASCLCGVSCVSLAFLINPTERTHTHTRV